MGSARCASYPADASTQVGANRSTTGATTSSRASRTTSPVARGGSGTLTVSPGAPGPPVSATRPVPGYSGHWWVET